MIGTLNLGNMSEFFSLSLLKHVLKVIPCRPFYRQNDFYKKNIENQEKWLNQGLVNGKNHLPPTIVPFSEVLEDKTSFRKNQL